MLPHQITPGELNNLELHAEMYLKLVLHVIKGMKKEKMREIVLRLEGSKIRSDLRPYSFLLGNWEVSNPPMKPHF